MRWLVQVLSGVGSLFLSGADFERYYGEGVRQECRFERVESGCPACVLAVVGGRQEVLMALRANMRARGKEEEPRLLGLVEAWMPLFGWHEQREMRAQSDALAAEIKEVRRWMHDRKVRKRMERGEDPEGGRSKHRGKLPAGTKMADGVPMPHFRLPTAGQQQQQQHHGSKHRGGLPEETRTVEGVPKIRVNVPNGNRQNDGVVYQAPGPVDGPGSAVHLEPASNGAVRQEEIWSSVVSTLAPSSYAASSYSSSSVCLTPSSYGTHLPHPSSKPYLTPSMSNPFAFSSSSTLPTHTSSTTATVASKPKVDLTDNYIPPSNNSYDGPPQGGFRPQRPDGDRTARGTANKSPRKKQTGPGGPGHQSTGTTWSGLYKR
ncbi:uncharacterized protein B0H64DRAFT_395329 [Chaetomium fimeti]|uniref:Uncharacterized protein n=1 Tax=Chaetomium fimeti TaxID=1854472 RepID=A0AAE0HF69_9PEZI|nr:hypothetical protein B0H64DRAFT_395329 [Chaetomium fimeti]